MMALFLLTFVNHFLAAFCNWKLNLFDRKLFRQDYLWKSKVCWQWYVYSWYFLVSVCEQKQLLKNSRADGCIMAEKWWWWLLLVLFQSDCKHFCRDEHFLFIVPLKKQTKCVCRHILYAYFSSTGLSVYYFCVASWRCCLILRNRVLAFMVTFPGTLSFSSVLLLKMSFVFVRFTDVSMLDRVHVPYKLYALKEKVKLVGYMC